MKDRTLNKKDMIEIEDYQADTKTIILEQIRKYRFVTREMLQKNCGLTVGMLNNAIRQLSDNHEIESLRKMVKYKGEKAYSNRIGYSFPK